MLQSSEVCFPLSCSQGGGCKAPWCQQAADRTCTAGHAHCAVISTRLWMCCSRGRRECLLSVDFQRLRDLTEDTRGNNDQDLQGSLPDFSLSLTLRFTVGSSPDVWYHFLIFSLSYWMCVRSLVWLRLRGVSVWEREWRLSMCKT